MFERACVETRAVVDDLDRIGLMLAQAFTKPEDDFDCQVAALVAELDVPSLKA